VSRSDPEVGGLTVITGGLVSTTVMEVEHVDWSPLMLVAT